MNPHSANFFPKGKGILARFAPIRSCKTADCFRSDQLIKAPIKNMNRNTAVANKKLVIKLTVFMPKKLDSIKLASNKF
jgi:hypothetical protein